MILQFGKYKGYDISNIPEDYLDWLISTTQKTLSDYKEEKARREYMQEASLPWVERVIQAGYRSLAMQHHPDHGGNTEDMRQINAAHEKLKQLVKK